MDQVGTAWRASGVTGAPKTGGHSKGRASMVSETTEAQASDERDLGISGDNRAQTLGHNTCAELYGMRGSWSEDSSTHSALVVFSDAVEISTWRSWARVAAMR